VLLVGEGTAAVIAGAVVPPRSVEKDDVVITDGAVVVVVGTPTPTPTPN